MATGGGELGGMSFPILFVLQAAPAAWLMLSSATQTKNANQTKLVSNILMIAAIVGLARMIIFRVGFEGFASSQLQSNIDGFQYIRELNFATPFTAALVMNAFVVFIHIIARIWASAVKKKNAHR